MVPKQVPNLHSKIATVWIISLSTIGYEYAIYDHTVCYLEERREREAEALMRRPGLQYHHRHGCQMAKVKIFRL